jgi:hypothetical protein
MYMCHGALLEIDFYALVSKASVRQRTCHAGWQRRGQIGQRTLDPVPEFRVKPAVLRIAPNEGRRLIAGLQAVQLRRVESRPLALPDRSVLPCHGVGRLTEVAAQMPRSQRVLASRSLGNHQRLFTRIESFLEWPAGRFSVVRE